MPSNDGDAVGFMYSGRQLLALAQQRERWGRWRLRPSNQTLYYAADGNWYEIDLEKCRTSAGMLDWIVQFHAKPFKREDAGCVTDLITALNNVVHIQGSLCSFGQSLTLSPADMRATIAHAAKLWPEACLGEDDYPLDMPPLAASGRVGTPIIETDDEGVAFGTPLIEP